MVPLLAGNEHICTKIFLKLCVGLPDCKVALQLRPQHAAGKLKSLFLPGCRLLTTCQLTRLYPRAVASTVGDGRLCLSAGLASFSDGQNGNAVVQDGRSGGSLILRLAPGFKAVRFNLYSHRNVSGSNDGLFSTFGLFKPIIIKPRPAFIGKESLYFYKIIFRIKRDGNFHRPSKSSLSLLMDTFSLCIGND